MTSDPIILVVEDEALIRLSTADTLRDLGWDVRESANAAEALQVLEQCEEVALIFTDIDMPGPMNGMGLARAVAQRWPPMIIVITSGMNQPSDADLPVGATFVPKPYVPEQLAEDFRARLSGS